MKAQIETHKGWTEAIINSNCEMADFFRIGDIVESKLNLVFSKKDDGFDSLYWDFDFDNANLTLHYNIYLGVSVFPSLFEQASELDNQKTIEISDLIIKELNK